MNLSKELNNLSEDFANKADESVQEKMRDGHDALAKKKVADSALAVNDTFPSFSLPQVDGGMFSSKEALESKRFLIVSFYRGGWCPYCQTELKAMNEYLERFNEHCAGLIALTPEKISKAQETQKQYAPNIQIAHDERCNFAEKVGLAFELPDTLKKTYKNDLDIDVEKFNGENDFRLPVPATYILDSDHKVVKCHVDIDYKERLDPDEIIEFLSKQVTH